MLAICLPQLKGTRPNLVRPVRVCVGLIVLPHSVRQLVQFGKIVIFITLAYNLPTV